MTEQTKVHGNTLKAADMSLAKKEISPASHEAVREGRLSLEEARDLGRDAGPDSEAPPKPESRISKDDATQECWCGCGEWTKPNRRWRPGHDQRAKGIIKRTVEADKTAELSDRLREYGVERGLIGE